MKNTYLQLVCQTEKGKNVNTVSYLFRVGLIYQQNFFLLYIVLNICLINVWGEAQEITFREEFYIKYSRSWILKWLELKTRKCYCRQTHKEKELPLVFLLAWFKVSVCLLSSRWWVRYWSAVLQVDAAHPRVSKCHFFFTWTNF